MITIGIDPGLERVGVAIIEKKEENYNLIFRQLIKTPSTNSQADRLLMINEKLSSIIEAHKVDSAAVEKLFFAKNIKTAMVVSEARGVILLTLKQFLLPIFEYTPLQVKQALTGYGRATKSQIQLIIKRILAMPQIEKSDDVADAMAVAITHINSYKIQEKLLKR